MLHGWRPTQPPRQQTVVRERTVFITPANQSLYVQRCATLVKSSLSSAWGASSSEKAFSGSSQPL